MNEVIDPNLAPGSPAGEVAPSKEAAPEVVPDPNAERLTTLERQNNELQRRLTEQGRKLARLQQPAPSAPAQPEAIDPSAYFTDPAGYTRKVMTEALTEYERRQEEKENARYMLEQAAARAGMTVQQMQDYHRRIAEAQADPDQYVEILARLHQAENVDKTVEAGKKIALEDANRNARAVTTEGGAPRATPPGKSFDDMSLEELREHIEKTYGVAGFSS